MCSNYEYSCIYIFIHSSLLKSSQTTLHNLKLQFSHIKDEKLVDVVKRHADIQVAKILMGDYELKLGRQKYFMSNQDKVTTGEKMDRIIVQGAQWSYIIKIVSYI